VDVCGDDDVVDAVVVTGAEIMRRGDDPGRAEFGSAASKPIEELFFMTFIFFC
jgi:hypothetical protein